MKHHVTFLAGMLCFLSLFAYLVFSLNQNGPFYFHDDRPDLALVLKNFQDQHSAEIKLNFSSLYAGRGQLQVLHPLLDVASFQMEELKPSCDPKRASDAKEGVVACSSPSAAFSDMAKRDFGMDEALAASRKTQALAQFLNEGLELSDDFLGTPPFVDRLGNSYAYLLAKKGGGLYKEKSWVESHLSYFKVSELREILSSHHIEDPYYSVISRLSETEIEAVVRGEPLVLTADYVLLKDQSRYGFSPLSYWVYKASAFETAVKDSKYQLVPQTAGTYCLEKMGNACWTYNSQYALAYLYRYSLAILILLGTAFCILTTFYLRRVYERYREQKKQRLSLQVLSHEFRTPVSSMLLIIDQLTAIAADLGPGDQDLLTRLSTEIFRLQRIVEVSKTYLQAEGGRIHFQPVSISSINTWIMDFVEESNLPLQMQLLPQDQGAVIDPFWLKFVLSNLVQNAFAHGQQPVCLRVQKEQDSFQFVVQDQGKCDFTSLRQMTDAFVKSPRSKGMGLGLNIVKSIVDEWGGEIRFSRAPTSFAVFVGNLKEH